MKGSPLNYPSPDLSWHIALSKFEVFYQYHRFPTSVLHMKVGRVVVIEIYGDFDSAKPGNLRHP